MAGNLRFDFAWHKGQRLLHTVVCWDCSTKDGTHRLPVAKIDQHELEHRAQGQVST